MTSTPADSINPFRLAVPQRDLGDLFDRLDRTRRPDALPGVGRSCGVPADHLRELVRH